MTIIVYSVTNKTISLFHTHTHRRRKKKHLGSCIIEAWKSYMLVNNFHLYNLFFQPKLFPLHRYICSQFWIFYKIRTVFSSSQVKTDEYWHHTIFMVLSGYNTTLSMQLTCLYSPWWVEYSDLYIFVFLWMQQTFNILYLLVSLFCKSKCR